MAILFVSSLSARAMCDAAVDRLDLGSGAALLRIYSGTAPTDADTALGAQVLLAELVMSDPAFGAAADSAPGATATASAIADDTAANATGTASFFRLYQSDGTTCEMQGDVTATGGGGTLTLNTVSIVINALVKVTALTMFHPES
jgi:hypothetical protein